MMLEKIEQEYAKYEPEFIEDIHRKVFYGQVMNQKYYEKLVNSFQFCLAGDIRADLGLTRDYVAGSVCTTELAMDWCRKCENFARLFSKYVRMQMKNNYLAELGLFKQHLEEEHGVKM